MSDKSDSGLGDGLPREEDRRGRKGNPDLGQGKKDPFIQDVIRRNFHTSFFLNMIELLLLCYVIVRVG